MTLIPIHFSTFRLVICLKDRFGTRSTLEIVVEDEEIIESQRQTL